MMIARMVMSMFLFYIDDNNYHDDNNANISLILINKTKMKNATDDNHGH